MNPVAREEVATNVLLVEWLVKLEQQLSVKQRLIEEQQQQIEAQQKQIEQLKEELHKLKNRSSKNSERPPFIRPAQKARATKVNAPKATSAVQNLTTQARQGMDLVSPTK